MSSTILDPSVIDASSLTPRQTSAIYLPIGIEGTADNDGDAVVATPYLISRVDEAVTQFGVTSSMTVLLTAILNRGAGPVKAIASKKGTGATLTDRQTAWAILESDEDVRIRLTDSETQGELAALADSCMNANLLNLKQICFVGMPSGTAKAALETASAAIDTDSASRAVLVAPGVYDEDGDLQGGSYAAACVAAEVAKNADPSNDLDLWGLPLLTGVELDAAGLSVFRRKVTAGVATDDYEDLLQAGISPLQPSRTAGGVMTTHLRTAFTGNSTYDNLYTRIIMDQVFLDVKAYILDSNFLRAGNSETTRARIQSGVSALLAARSSWISPITQGDGTTGYAVSVTPSSDNRQVTVGYQGTIVRGITSVQVAANLTIPV